MQPRIDWEETRRSGLLGDYMSEVQCRLGPFLNKSYNDVGQIEDEIKLVAHRKGNRCETTAPCRRKKIVRVPG